MLMLIYCVVKHDCVNDTVCVRKIYELCTYLKKCKHLGRAHTQIIYTHFLFAHIYLYIYLLNYIYIYIYIFMHSTLYNLSVDHCFSLSLFFIARFEKVSKCASSK